METLAVMLGYIGFKLELAGFIGYVIFSGSLLNWPKRQESANDIFMLWLYRTHSNLSCNL